VQYFLKAVNTIFDTSCIVTLSGDVVFRGDDKFGLGFQIVSEKNGNVPAQAGTYSWGGAYSTSYWVDPKEKMVMLFYRQLQSTTHGDLAEKFRALAYQALND
jgi:CubicO group peptidase (beta-lactamase class C family)